MNGEQKLSSSTYSNSSTSFDDFSNSFSFDSFWYNLHWFQLISILTMFFLLNEPEIRSNLIQSVVFLTTSINLHLYYKENSWVTVLFLFLICRHNSSLFLFWYFSIFTEICRSFRIGFSFSFHRINRENYVNDSQWKQFILETRPFSSFSNSSKLMNSTETNRNSAKNIIACSLSGTFGVLAIISSLMIMILIRLSKPRLHTVRHLLICNTCLASILYCVIQLNNYLFLIFETWDTTDIGCRWRSYFSYMSIAANVYSYLAQALSRYFFAILPIRYHSLTTFKAHYILIFIHWTIMIILPLPAIVTEDIFYQAGNLCWVPLRKTLHIFYTVFAYFLIAIIFIVIIYFTIYRQVKRARLHATTILNLTKDKRDLDVLRNVLILLGIYISGGIPTILFMMTRIEALYYVGIVTITLSVAIEKICTVLLDRDLRQTVRTLLATTNRIMPFETVTRLPRAKEENFTISARWRWTTN